MRIAVIDNTLRLEKLWVSENLAVEMEDRQGIEVSGGLHPLALDAEGWLLVPEGNA